MFRKYVKGGIRIPEIDFEPQFLPTAHLTALRPCLADDKPATFHRWVDESGLLCCTTLALVEYPDGSVGMVKPELIQFLDRKED